ncbi:MAG: M23 family metallopeptidase [Candidatus Omnitrophica bacterium]|jgi:murein DD-endopeptidase MepM/ murein hydrolase activator NlpD|nr:M23 family metallopeptidase [Candidatus Omnitrophota bacterium]
MKKIFLFLLLILPIYLIISISFLDKKPFLCPVQYKGDFIIRSDSRGDGTFASPRNGRRVHKGIDLLGAVGTPVVAVRSGKVIAARSNNGMGKYVVISHSGDVVTIYGHLQQIYTKEGDFIMQGTVLGSVGKTGNARSNGIQPHLHFEVRKNGIAQDPLEYL